MPNPKPPASTGGIVRRAHDRENPYVQISRALANDAALSLEARGLMLYLLAKPADWQIQMGDLQRAAGCGRDQMKRIMRELETAGYVVRTRSHTERGHWVWESMVYEVPQRPGEPSTENPSMVQPSMVPPSPEKASINKTTTGLTNDIQIKEDTAAPPHTNGSVPPLLTGWLYMIAAETASELHLPGDVPARVRAAWERSGLDETAMADRLYQARTRARKARGDKAAAYWAAIEQG